MIAILSERPGVSAERRGSYALRSGTPFLSACPSPRGFAFVAVTIFGLMYGISPAWYAATFLHITDLNLNVAHILRAVAGLYLALAAFWLYAGGLPRQIQRHGPPDGDPICGRARRGSVCKLDRRWSTRTDAIELWRGGSRGCSDRLLGLHATGVITVR
jgi:hypothetical protein